MTGAVPATGTIVEQGQTGIFRVELDVPTGVPSENLVQEGEPLLEFPQTSTQFSSNEHIDYYKVAMIGASVAKQRPMRIKADTNQGWGMKCKTIDTFRAWIMVMDDKKPGAWKVRILMEAEKQGLAPLSPVASRQGEAADSL